MTGDELAGRIDDLRIPSAMAATRTEQLWQATCFEAFVRPSAATEYYEFNFAPSTQWAAYRFSAYRSGMSIATEINAPRIEVQSSRECYTLRASLELDGLSLRGIDYQVKANPVTLEAAPLTSNPDKSTPATSAVENAFVPKKGILQFFLSEAVRVKS